jgi:hypothetical protein
MLLSGNKKVNRGEYHIHIDASYLNPQTEDELLNKLGFTDTAFSGHAEGALHFETPKHFTFKTKDIVDFNRQFDTTEQYFTNNPGSIIGYLEGEYVPLDVEIEVKRFDRTVPIPLKLELSNLEPGSFREDEIHITLDRDKSDPQLLENLRGMGFFSAYMDKPQGNVEIFTAQGTKKNINLILGQMKDYLDKSGGAVGGSIKEEIILKWWLSNPQVTVPPTATIAN